MVQHEVVVIAGTDLHLLVGIGDILTQLFCRTEIQRSFLHGTDLAGGDQILAHRSEAVRVDPYEMILHGFSAVLTMQIEIAVVRHIDQGNPGHRYHCNEFSAHFLL